MAAVFERMLLQSVRDCGGLFATASKGHHAKSQLFASNFLLVCSLHLLHCKSTFFQMLSDSRMHS
uniref:Uncharacterized protein n=1 Tax=Magnetococcus massalia (strain MO-1) TaxID=451514 RepID=A0A1S7LJE4_MAGMO|nr:protein of unknown function [Candidatus Magnetococcus massalia]